LDVEEDHKTEEEAKMDKEMENFEKVKEQPFLMD
jgi:hypothetical protein